MDLIEDIGPILGIVAFLGFAILALLIVLQAREVRRLREWAGRAPERASEADDAATALSEAKGETEEGPGVFARARARIVAAVGPRWAEIDRRSPVDLRWLALTVAVLAVAAGAVVGFGVFDRDEQPAGSTADSGREEPREPEPEEVPEVAVLNATQVEDELAPVSAVPGLAEVVAKELVKPAGFRLGVRTNAPAGEEESLIMFAPGADEDADELAAAVETDLGPTGVVAMSEEVRSLVRGADLVLLVGFDDAEFGASGA